MEPYSFRSKMTEKSAKKMSGRKKNNVVDRLYTIKTDQKKINSQTINPVIRVEDSTPNSKYKTYLENPFLEGNMKTLAGNQTVVHKNGTLLSPFKTRHRHRHSNSDTLIKSSSFKSSNHAQLLSKYVKKEINNNNPSLMISKKPLEKQFSASTNNSKQMVMSKLAGEVEIINMYRGQDNHESRKRYKRYKENDF